MVVTVDLFINENSSIKVSCFNLLICLIYTKIALLLCHSALCSENIIIIILFVHCDNRHTFKIAPSLQFPDVS